MLSYLSDAPLGKYCTFLTGGRARRLVFAYTRDDLADAAACGALVLGRGSNVLVGDAGYAGDVVVNRTGGYALCEDTCVCDSGVLLSALARVYAASGRDGLSWAYGLPGTVGGAAVGNAGAFGGCMADVVQSVTVYDGDKVRAVSAEACGFAYRRSAIPGTVLSLTLKAPHGDADSVRAACERNLAQRKSKQPRGASAGCVFKAADGVPAGLLIERAGLKGLCCGGAQVSEKHANFIVNRGGASAADILQLINTVQAAVFDETGIRLEREIKLLGDFF